MTIQWGSFDGGLRIGIQIEGTTSPSNGSTTCTVTVSFWVGTSSTQTFSDSQTLFMSQSGGTSISDTSVPYSNNLSQNQTMKVGPNQTVVYTYSNYGVADTVNIVGSATGLFNGGTPNKTIVATIPARPWANPAAATASSATRVSDTQATVAWTNHDTTPAKYSNIKVYRKTDTGAFALISTLGIVSSYSDTGIVANHKYRYRPNVLGMNGVEVTGPETGDIWTTPAAPITLVATKLSGGNIRLTWVNKAGYSEYTVRIEESQNGGAYSEIASVTTGIATWDHVAPSTSVTHKYRVRARTSSGATLNSSYSNESSTITLLATANAPSGLAPAGAARDATEIIVFTWTHNPADGTPQTKYQLQYKIDAGSFVTVGPTTNGVSSYSMPASTLTNGHTITWHVATAGENGIIGAYSADSVFTASARPTSVISSPSGGTYNFSMLTVTWTYFQQQSSAQTSWHAYLWLKGALSDFSDATLLEEQVGSGATATLNFAHALNNGATYGVRVYVTSAAGLTSIASGTGLAEFTVTFLPPADATLTATYDPDFGRMNVTVTGDGAVLGTTVTISTVDLQRQIDGGDWVTWATGVILTGTPLVAALVDTAPTVRGINSYRAIVYSATPSSAISATTTVVTTETQWGFLSTGSDFEQLVRLRARLSSKTSNGREKAIYQFEGRRSPVELSGEATPLVLSVNGTLYPPSRGGLSSEPDAFEAIAETSRIVLWRDYTGRRVFASLGQVDIDFSNDSVIYPVGFNLTRVDYNENVE